MGLFDKIKKSLFGHKDEDQGEKEEHKVDEETTEEAQDSEVNTEAGNPQNESDLALKETNKPDEETEDSDETPGWSDAGSAFEESQNEVEEKTTKAEDTSSEESKSEEYEDKISVSEPETDLAENTEEESAEKEDEQERYDKGLAKRIKDSGKSVMMVAADTFRAGAVEQLVEWGRRDGVEVVTGPEKADPASVVYDGVKKAKDREIDFLLVDTAGRLQNKVNLMSELDKIKRTIKKILPDQPNEVLLVLDGSTGQNALLQAKDFDKTTKLTGLVLTKLDGSSKGGVVLAIRNEMDLPVKLVGLGEKVDDLANFDAEKFAIGLFQGLI